mmetsp:Transcript_41976/g.30807  ORF Transcript_41976/g.30807 Transcript_41976/m.30807 type:complete len:86 (-) Transcript_41976:142-399(-)
MINDIADFIVDEFSLTEIERGKVTANRNKLLKQFSYKYDKVVGLGMTRYEIGLWILVLALYCLRKYLVTCGNRKTEFDFMRPAKA